MIRPTMIAIAAALAAADLDAATIRVPRDVRTIQAAIDAARDGDIIEVARGTYRENLTIPGKSVTIRSTGCPCAVDVDGGGRDSVLTIAGPGSPTIEGLRIRGGRAPHGAGIRIVGPASPTVRNTCVVDNVALAGGGGIAILGGPGSARIENTLIARNRAPEGAGIFIEGPVAPVIVNDTIAENRSDISAGGIVNRGGGQPVIFNAILWLNRAGPGVRDIDGLSLPMIAFSTIGDGQYSGANGNDDADPRFEDSVAGNYRLRGDSPAIDAGVETYGAPRAPDEDIEGSPRYDQPLAPNQNGGKHDKGIDEVSPAFVRGDANTDGTVDIADPIYTLDYIFGFVPNPPCLNAMDVNDLTGVDLADPCFLLAYLFQSGDPIPPPFPKIGLDNTKPEHACSKYRPCGM